MDSRFYGDFSGEFSVVAFTLAENQSQSRLGPVLPLHPLFTSESVIPVATGVTLESRFARFAPPLTGIYGSLIIENTGN